MTDETKDPAETLDANPPAPKAPPQQPAVAKKGPGRPSNADTIAELKAEVARQAEKIAMLAAGQASADSSSPRVITRVLTPMPEIPEGADPARVCRAAGVIPTKLYNVRGENRRKKITVYNSVIAVDESEAISQTVVAKRIQETHSWVFVAEEAEQAAA